MISNGRLRTLARETGVTAGLAEKNYVNSWILYAIYTGSLAEQFVSREEQHSASCTSRKYGGSPKI